MFGLLIAMLMMLWLIAVVTGATLGGLIHALPLLALATLGLALATGRLSLRRT